MNEHSRSVAVVSQCVLVSSPPALPTRGELKPFFFFKFQQVSVASRQASQQVSGCFFLERDDRMAGTQFLGSRGEFFGQIEAVAGKVVRCAMQAFLQDSVGVEGLADGFGVARQ